MNVANAEDAANVRPAGARPPSPELRSGLGRRVQARCHPLGVGVLAAALIGACHRNPEADNPAGAELSARATGGLPAAASPSLDKGPRAAGDLAEGADAPRGEDDTVHGTLRTIDGQKVLHVWGSPYEMGYAHGSLLREAIIKVVDDYALDAIPKATFGVASASLAKTGVIDDRLREEARGVIAGMEASGGAHSRGLGRALTIDDLLLVNTMTDLVAIGCSSVSAWGSATVTDPELKGELAVVRNLDWAADPALLESQVIIAYEPSSAEEQPVVSVAFAGYLGCLSCINGAGVTGLFNMGYGDGAASLTEAAAGFAPANLLLRSAMSARDVDGDGRSTADDVIHLIEASEHAGSYIVHLVEPAKVAKAGGRPPARVIEVEAAGVGVRTASEGSRLGPEILAATNHLRERAPPQACSRYRRIEQTVAAREQSLRLEPLWALGEAVRIDEAVVHTMLVIPAKRQLSVRLRAPGLSMSRSPAPVIHRWAELFGDRPGAEG